LLYKINLLIYKRKTTPPQQTTTQGVDMEEIIFVSNYIVKPTLFAIMILSIFGAAIVMYTTTTTKGE